MSAAIARAVAENSGNKARQFIRIAADFGEVKNFCGNQRALNIGLLRFQRASAFAPDGDTTYLQYLQVKIDSCHGFSRYVNVIDRQIREIGLLREQRVRAGSKFGEPIDAFRA